MKMHAARYPEETAVIDGINGRSRVVIEGITPEIDGGRFPIKRTVGERVVVEADVFGDGHDLVSAALLYRRESDPEWQEVALSRLVNDRWRGEFPVGETGRYCYTVRGWIDHFGTWVHDLGKRIEAGQDVTVDLEIGALMVDEASSLAKKPDASHLRDFAAALRTHGGAGRALSPELHFLMDRNGPRHFSSTYDRELLVVVDPIRARYSTWYEFFPRSAGKGTTHGTFKDAEAWLPDIAAMGFDVLYFPPIHPVGVAHRKGMNNTTTAEPGDPGSPWAIGGADGGHKSILPELGTLADFKHLIDTAGKLGIDVAMDIAFQAAPDHPYATEHRTWFRERPDGTIQYAENPPKKYQDIYPFDFESADWQAMWDELASVFRYWCEQGIRIFRVDNPHTKAFVFWEWCIAEIKRDYPDAIFLSEAFTRPKVMYRLAKAGFNQSYTYFTWRNTPWEIRRYFTELTQPPVIEFFRPNLWPNTPDILPEYLQHGGRPAFVIRLILAATLGANYGMYGPAYELLENTPTAPGREEYLFSEKYEIKDWDRDRPDSLREIMTIVNRVRRDNPALQSDRNLTFHPIDNDQMIAYTKATDDGLNLVLTVVNTDPYNPQSGWLELPLAELGIDETQPYQVHDQLGGGRYLWHGARNFVQLDPNALPGHIFVIRRRVRTERDFDYFV